MAWVPPGFVVRAAVFAALIVLAETPTALAQPPTQTFDYTGAEQSYVVPADITALKVVAVGAPGGAGRELTDATGSPGGDGARVTGVISVTPGETIYVEVGGSGADAGVDTTGGLGGFNGGGNGGGTTEDPPGGGGGGGGASDVRTVSCDAPCEPLAPASLASRLLVAAGGGGGGGGFDNAYDQDVPDGGAGGGAIDAGAPGGNGAGLTDGGGGASSTGPGTGGIACDAIGSAGEQGAGGAGAGASYAAGGGGGGGLYGGGGGGGEALAFDCTGQGGGGGGGGGSSSAPPQSTFAQDQTGAPSVTITPLVPVGPATTFLDNVDTTQWTYQVPHATVAVEVNAIGSAGAAGQSGPGGPGGPGGAGADISAAVAMQHDQSLYVVVPQPAGSTYQGGGDGGQLSSVGTLPCESPCNPWSLKLLAAQLIVAGGGGGGGASGRENATGGAGGAAGQSGMQGSPGGEGPLSGLGGSGATQAAPGTGGLVGTGDTCPGTQGYAGSPFFGGQPVSGSGGGGGGVYGGGGGGAGCVLGTQTGAGGGGGGGSSRAPVGASYTTATGTPSVTITALGRTPKPQPRPRPRPAPDNHFNITDLRIGPSGLLKLTVQVPGPGSIDVLETAWDDDLASVAQVLQPAPDRFVFGRADTEVGNRRTVHFVIKPTSRGQRLVHHHRYRIPLRLWVTYTPTAGQAHSVGAYDVHLSGNTNLPRAIIASRPGSR
jgi:hypothetical protein